MAIRFFFVGVLMLGIFSFDSITFAQNSSGHQQGQVGSPLELPEQVLKGRIVIDHRKPTPSPDCEVEISGIEVYTLNDGTRVVGGSGAGQPGDPPQSFDWEVNIDEGTYTTWEVNQETTNYLKSITPQQRSKKQFAVDQTSALSTGSSIWDSLTQLLTPQAAFAGINPGIYVHQVTILARDPIGLIVAVTGSELGWLVSVDRIFIQAGGPER